MAERLKARVCGRSLAGIAGLNPGRGVDVCVMCVVSKDKKAKCRTIKTQKQVRIKYKVVQI